MISLDIVVVNWNAGYQIKECLDSINDLDCTTFQIGEVIVVDNNSSDDSIENIKKERYNYLLRIIENSYNAGFAKACNQGAQLCQSKYILFLNPDTKLFKDSLNEVIVYHNSNEHLGVVGIQLIDENKEIARTCRKFPNKRNRVAKILGLTRVFPGTGTEMVNWDHNELKEVDQVMGAFFLVKRELFNKLRGFDERFFVYYEEVDFCKRMQEMGYKNIFYPHSQAFHKGGGTSNQVKDLRLFYSLRSWLKYERKHKGTFQMCLSLIIELGEYLSRYVFLVANGRKKETKELNKAYKLLIKSLREI